MTRKVVVTASAVADLEAIGEWILIHNPEAAIQTVSALRERCLHLAGMPWVGRLVPRRAGLRKLVAGSYVVFYKVEPDMISVIRIMHGTRDIEDVIGGA